MKSYLQNKSLKILLNSTDVKWCFPLAMKVSNCLLSHAHGPLRNHLWTNTSPWNRLAEPLVQQTPYLLMTALVSLLESASLSFLRYLGTQPRPNAIPGISLKLFGKKVIISIGIAKISIPFTFQSVAKVLTWSPIVF